MRVSTKPTVLMTKFILLMGAACGPVFLSSSLLLGQTATNALVMNTRTTASPLPDPFSAKITEPVHFCGENMPVDLPAITSRWTRMLSRQAAQAADLILLQRRASVVFPLIEPILKHYRIPLDFKFLPLLESAVTNRAVSRRGAAGFWQLMPQTAQSLGLRVSRRNDERFNLRKATHAACRYLGDLYKQLGSWMLVASAYNAGPTYIGHLARQHPTLHPMALPYRAAETKAYLYQAVAIKELLTHPQAYRSYLSIGHLEALSNGSPLMPPVERTAILASFDMDESAFAATAPDSTALVWLACPTDSVATVALLTDDDEPVADTITGKVSSAPAPIDRPLLQLVTRSLSEGPLTEGKLCLFQVVQAIDFNGRSFAVGDIIQAHIEVIDAVSGRVFLRTDQHTTAVSQQTAALNFVATSQPRQPGVDLPLRLENWRLTWESL